jgi:hypothetical protein
LYFHIFLISFRIHYYVNSFSPLAAGIPFAGLTAMNAVYRVSPGTKVLVFGAGGAVGYFVINFLANIMGCRVTAVCGKKDMAKVCEVYLFIYLFIFSSLDLFYLFSACSFHFLIELGVPCLRDCD